MSLKKIAELTNTSPATVSRVLNHPDYRCQNPDLTEQIRKTAREMNYIPNQNARNLKLGDISHADKVKCTAIDLLMARFDSLDKDPFFAELFRCLETEFHHMNCVIRQTLNIPDITLTNAQKKRPKSRGLMILGKCPPEILDRLTQRYTGVIAIDRNPMDYKIDEVICDGSRAAFMAVEHLLELGHTKIAYIGDCNMEARYMGYYECLLAHKIPLTYDFIIPTNQTREDGYRAFCEIFSRANRPSAVFCANDITALGCIAAMKECNGRKKQQVYKPAVISIDDIKEASEMSPLLTTVRIPKEDMAHLATLTLLDRLQKGHREPVRLELPCRLIIRESCSMYIP